MRISIISLVALVPLVIATPLSTTPHSSSSDDTTFAPLSKEGQSVEDHYIVVLKPEVGINGLLTHLSGIESASLSSPLVTFSPTTGEVQEGGIKHVYRPNKLGKGWYGYAGAFTPDVLEMIRARPEVDYVEHDQVISVITDLPSEDPVSAFISDVTEEEASNDNHGGHFFRDELVASPSDISTERGAPWGLARISHREPLHLSTFTKYEYATASVDDGIDIYIIDTGVNIDHVELEGRARWGKTIPRGASDFDGNGHGSHCAGIAASRKYGVAKGANIVAVKVLGDNGSGTLSDVIAGITWAAEQAADKAERAAREFATTGKTTYKGSVGSMSLGGGKSQATDDAVNAAVESGMYMSVAAGNDNKDASDYSPARAKKAIAVGASTLGDKRAYFSNHGDTVAIMAPGLNILSIWNGGNQSSNTISGTSMACPAVSGLIAYYLGAYGSPTLPYMTPKQRDQLEKEDVSLEQIMQGYAAADASDSASIYANAYNFLPSYIQKFAPTPKKPEGNNLFTPNQMRGLIRKLATKGVLSDLPKGTPNLLAFNNATISK